ncbi:Protein-S-isoprenylcysteine O-methyltransferase [Mycena kentingensis (nom. inval.)]|nr:Protein-S-isoprenylcysteine O-methyltransferase [Mycena kentingensis (nom. inval.)]
MSVLKIPLLLAVELGTHVSMTAPNPPPAEPDQLPPRGIERVAPRAVPLLMKACFWAFGLAEVVVLAAQRLPGATKLLHLLDFSSGERPTRLALTTPFLIGAALNLAGSILRIHCYRRLRHFFTFELGVSASQHLITDGVYSVVRHPSYSGALLVGVGVALCTLTPGAWAVECTPLGDGRALAALWCAAVPLAMFGLHTRMNKEDAMLRERFPDEWDAWAKRVPRRMFLGVY